MQLVKFFISVIIKYNLDSFSFLIFHKITILFRVSELRGWSVFDHRGDKKNDEIICSYQVKIYDSGTHGTQLHHSFVLRSLHTFGSKGFQTL